MKKILYILAMAVATMFTSCQKDADVVDLSTLDRVVEFSSESIVPLTRVSGTSWDENDAIGITMLSSSDNSTIIYDNIKYTAETEGSVSFNTATEETILYPEDGSAVDFAAYYPYQEEWSYEDGSMVIDLSVQDGTLDAQSKVDILESAITNQTYGKQNLTFTHSLSKVQITVSNHDMVSEFENLDNLTATLYTKRVHYNLLTKEITKSDENKELQMVKTTDGDKAIYTTIFAPGEVSDKIIFTDGTSFYTATLAISDAEAGKLYSFSATVGDQGYSIIELENDGVTDWDMQTDSTISTTDIAIVDGVYQIYTAAGLKTFASTVNGGSYSLSAKLMDDIDLKGSEDNQWTPIGTSSTNAYTGTFDGGGFDVSGLYINGSSDYQGLFGYADGATISNVGVAGSVTAGTYVGAIVGYADCSIVNCYSLADVTGTDYVGGVAGVALNSTICYSAAALTGTGTNVGGVIGECTSSATYCYFDSDKYLGEGIGSGNGEATGLSTADMQSTLLLYHLNNGVYTYNLDSPAVEAYAWKAVSEGYPTFDIEGEATYTQFDIGYESSVYKIYTAKGMQTFADLVNGSEQSVSDLFIDNSTEDVATYFNFGTAQTTINGELMNNIELSGTWSSMVPNAADDNGYGGIFDGGGYSITGLSVSGSESGQGLFSSVAYATIKNLKVGGAVSNSASHAAIITGKAWYSTIENCETLEGSTLTGTGGDSHAGIAGYSYQCSFTSCINRADITGVSCSAGITGYTNDNTSYSTITDCKNYGTITATSTSNGHAAGIVGTTNAKAILVISNCYNEGVIKSESGNFAGGIVAKMYGTSSSRYSKVVNCANIGKVSAAGQYVGGLVGACAGSAIYNSYNLGEVSSDSSEVGGLVGIHEAYDNYVAVMENCYISAAVTGSSNVGLAVGKCDASTITSCYYNSSQSGVAIGTDNNSQIVIGCSTSFMQSANFTSMLNNGAYSLTSAGVEACAWTAVSSDYPTLKADGTASYTDFSSCTAIGSGTESAPYLIMYGAQLRDLASDVNGGTTYSGNYFKMMCDIDLGGSSNEFTAIGSTSSKGFQGTFDGGGYEVSGLYIYQSSSDYQGLFGFISGATVKNLGVSGSVTGGYRVGGVVGYNASSSTVSGCYNTASVSGSYSVGGIVGYNTTSSSVSNSYNTGSVKGDDNYVGGVVGYNTTSSTVSGCYNTGSVKGDGSYVGGVVGYNTSSSSVSGCYNTGSVEGDGSSVGGVVGQNYSFSTVSNCIYDSAQYTGNALGSSYGTSTNNSGSTTLISTMTGGSFSTTLGIDNWKEDYSTQINNGYPILLWQ